MACNDIRSDRPSFRKKIGLVEDIDHQAPVAGGRGVDVTARQAEVARAHRADGAQQILGEAQR